MSTDLYFYPLVLSTCMRSVRFSKISRIVQRHKLDIRRSDACLFATTTTKEQRSSHPTSTPIKLHLTSDLMTHLTFLPTLNVRHPLDVCGSYLTLSSLETTQQTSTDKININQSIKSNCHTTASLIINRLHVIKSPASTATSPLSRPRGRSCYRLAASSSVVVIMAECG